MAIRIVYGKSGFAHLKSTRRRVLGNGPDAHRERGPIAVSTPDYQVHLCGSAIMEWILGALRIYSGCPGEYCSARQSLFAH